MGIYQKDTYKKNSKGKWIKTKTTIEKIPHDVGRWNQSCNLEKQSSLGERTYLKKAKTRTGINQKVIKASTYFGKNEKVVRTLITTANKLPRNRSRP